MSQGQDDFEERLRRALHAAADPVEPAGDGLDRIRSRLTGPRPALIVWFMGFYAGAARWVLGGLHSVLMWVRALAVAAGQRWRAARGTRWWRAHVSIAAVLGVAALAVAMGIFAATPYGWQALSGSVTNAPSRQAAGPGGRGGGSENGQGEKASPGVTGHSTHSGAPAPSPSPCQAPALSSSPNPWASPASTACAGPSAGPSPSATPTSAGQHSQSPQPSPSTSPTPSSSPSPSGTSGPPASPSPSGSSSPPASSPSPSAAPSESSSAGDASPPASPAASPPSLPASDFSLPAGFPAVFGVFSRSTHAVFRLLVCAGEQHPRGMRCHGSHPRRWRDVGRWPLAGHRSPVVANRLGPGEAGWGHPGGWPGHQPWRHWYSGSPRRWGHWPGW